MKKIFCKTLINNELAQDAKIVDGILYIIPMKPVSFITFNFTANQTKVTFSEVINNANAG